MNFWKAVFLVDMAATVLILLTSSHPTPLYGTAPYRIGGIFVPSHLLILAASSALITWMSYEHFVWTHFILTTVIQFVIAQLIHLVLGTNTMFLFSLGLSQKPDGTGYLAVPVSHEF